MEARGSLMAKEKIRMEAWKKWELSKEFEEASKAYKALESAKDLEAFKAAILAEEKADELELAKAAKELNESSKGMEDLLAKDIQIVQEMTDGKMEMAGSNDKRFKGKESNRVKVFKGSKGLTIKISDKSKSFEEARKKAKVSADEDSCDIMHVCPEDPSDPSHPYYSPIQLSQPKPWRGE